MKSAPILAKIDLIEKRLNFQGLINLPDKLLIWLIVGKAMAVRVLDLGASLGCLALASGFIRQRAGLTSSSIVSRLALIL
jgi:hypothetical protein